MEHAPTSAMGTTWERTPWRATQRAAWKGVVVEDGGREAAALTRLTTAFLLLVALAVVVEAQDRTRVWRVGFLGPGSPSSGDPRVEALRRGFP
jgi:hypothetical protein